MAAEIMALAGVDAIVIDHEHGPADLMSAIGIMQAVSTTDATTITRVPSHDFIYVKRALDTGIEGIMFPSVNTAEQARAVVAACRYPP
jgi:4-hydroxy-2-oxoheptanedioate aldolase